MKLREFLEPLVNPNKPPTPEPRPTPEPLPVPELPPVPEERFSNIHGKIDGRFVRHIRTDFGSFEEIQQELRSKLEAGKCVALTGMPGAGKTYLARQFAHDLYLAHDLYHKRMVDRVWWINAEWSDENKDANLRAGLLELGTEGLGLSDLSGDELSITKVITALEKNSAYLIVFDNMDGYFRVDERYQIVEKYFDELSSGRILITTRDEAVNFPNSMDYVSVPCLQEQEGADFLLDQAKWPENEKALDDVQKNAREISSLVGGLVLSLNHAAAFIRREKRRNRTYTLPQYIIGYKKAYDAAAQEAEAQSARIFEPDDRPEGDRHVSVHATLKMPFYALCDGNDAEKQAAELLRVWAFFASDNIPLLSAPEDSNEENSDSEEAKAEAIRKMKAADEKIDEAAQKAAELHLLQYYPNEGIIDLHRSVRAVLQDIVMHENARDKSKQQARKMLNRKLSELKAIPDDSALSHQSQPFQLSLYELAPHLDRLLRDISESELEGLEELDFCRKVFDIAKQRDEGKELGTLLFGGEVPSYKAMHWGQKSEERKTVARRMVLVHYILRERPEEARLLFACAYLASYYWWDCYLEKDNICDPLLELWESLPVEQKDTELIQVLRDFDEKYPTLREYQKFKEKSEEWTIAGNKMLEVQTMLGIANPANLTGSLAAAKSFTRAVSNIFVADALCYGEKMANYQYPENQSALELKQETKRLFDQLERDEYKFYHSWIRWEIGELHLLSGQQCATEGDIAKAQGYFAKAREECEDGLKEAINQAQKAVDENDDIDAEVIANLYSVLASLDWAEAKRNLALKIMCHCCATVYLAYALVLASPDNYGIEYYEEQVDHTIDWIIEFIESPSDTSMPDETALDEAVPLFQFARNFWGEVLDVALTEPVLTRDKVRTAFENQDREKLKKHLCPLSPGKLGENLDAELYDGAREKIATIVKDMPAIIAEIAVWNSSLLPEEFVTVAQLLKKQLLPAESSQDAAPATDE